MRLALNAAVLLWVALAGCSSPEAGPAPTESASPAPKYDLPSADAYKTVEPSSACNRSMARVTEVDDYDKRDPFIVKTRSACLTADEWFSALANFPDAMGLADKEAIRPLDLDAACGSDRMAAACADGVKQGYIRAAG